MSGRGTTLVWRRRRFCCGNCGERHLEDHTQFQGGLTRRFARRLVADATVMSIRAASRHHGVGWHRIMRLVSAEAARVAERRRARPSRVLLVDETSIRRRALRGRSCTWWNQSGPLSLKNLVRATFCATWDHCQDLAAVAACDHGHIPTPTPYRCFVHLTHTARTGQACSTQEQALVPLTVGDPLAQRLRRAAELLHDRTDCRPLRAVLPPDAPTPSERHGPAPPVNRIGLPMTPSSTN